MCLVACLACLGRVRRAPAAETSQAATTSEALSLLDQSRDLEGSDTAAALQKAQQAVEAARRNESSSQELEGLVQIGRTLRLLNDYPATLKAITQGMDLAEKLGDQRQMGELFELRGLVEWNQADLPKATVSMMEALRRGQTLGDKPLQLGALYGRGLVRARTDDIDGAFENLQSSLRLAEELHDPRLGQVLNSLGVLYLRRKDYPHAREFLERALAALQTTTNQRTMAYALLNLGQVATETGDQEASGKYLEQSESLCTRFDFQRGLADIYYLRGARQRRLGNLDGSFKELDQALALSKKLDNPDLDVCIYQEYIESAQARGDFHAALDYTRKLAAGLEVVRGEKTRRQAAEIQAHYDAESHAREIKLLERDRDLQQAKLDLKDSQLGRTHLFFGAVAVVLLLVGFMLAALASGQRAHAQLAERTLVETRAAKEEVELADAHKAQLLAAASRDLLESEARFRSAFEYSPLGLALVALDGRWLRVNQALCKIVGYSEAELLARTFQSITQPDDLAPDLQLVARLVAGEINSYCVEKRYVHKSGHLVWVRLDVSLVRDPSGARPDYFISQIDDITERRRAQEQLRVAKEEAETANEAKNAFLSRMSHELRTPLNAILGFGQLLEVADLGERQNQSVEHIVSAGRHLLELINEVLDIAQIESGKFHLNVEPISVSEILSGAARLMESAAREAGVSLHFPSTEDNAGLFIRVDPLRLRQILTNLLSNAVKYNHPNGEVFVRCRAQHGRVRLEVEDTGRGILREDLEKIFAPFARLAATEGVRGAGLGLSVAKALTEVMGGTLSVTSELGRGSTFAVEFDLLSAEQAAEVPLPSLDGLLLDFYGESPQDDPVLYIEDNPDNLDLVRYIFTGMPGLSLRTAATGKAGVEAANAEPPALVLLDLDLPDMTGVEVLARLRQSPAVAKVPVVVISADATTRQIETLCSFGVRDYLTKPLDLARFRQVVGEAVAASKSA